ncbi:MAG: hypothetical protein WC483_03950 [Candidatus Paceibacterota bacterium]
MPVIRRSGEIKGIHKVPDGIREKKPEYNELFGSDGKVREIIQKTMSFVEKYIGKNNPKAYELSIARTHHEFAEERTGGYEFPLGRFQTREQLICDLKKKPKKGTYDFQFARIILNLQAINEAHADDGKARDACLIATAIHETVHHLGGFERFHRSENRGFSLKWLTEAANEVITSEVMNAGFKGAAADLRCHSPDFEIGVKMEELLGHETLVSAYFEGSFFPIKVWLEEVGIPEDHIRRMLELGHRYDYSLEKEKNALERELHRHLDRMLAIVRKRRAHRMIEEHGDEPGMSTRTIDAVRMMLPGGQDDAAARLALGACLIYKLKEGVEPAAREAFAIISDAHDRSGGILAGTFNEIYAEAPELISESGIIPEPIKNETGAVGMLTAGIDEDSSYQAIMLLEAATTNYVLKNEGALPGKNELGDTISRAYESAFAREGVVPNAQILTSELCIDTKESAGSAYASEAHAVVSGIEAIDKNLTAIYETPYSAETEPLMTSLFCAAQEFGDLGPMVLDRCVAIYSDIGEKPTCGDIITLAAAAASLASETGLIKAYGMDVSALGNEYQVARCTINMINSLGEATREEALADIRSKEENRDSPKTYWERKVTDPGRTEALAAATLAYASLIRVQQPSEKVICTPDSLIVAIGPDGKAHKPGELVAIASSNVVGSVGDVSDIRKDRAEKTEIPEGVYKTSGLSARQEPDGPFGLPAEGRAIAENVKNEFGDEYSRLRALFEILKKNGRLGIQGTMFADDRKGGSKTIAEVLSEKKANCLELTMAFVEITKEAMGVAIVFPLEVVNIQQRTEVGHACAGVLLEDGKFDGHPAFNNDYSFRKAVLDRFGVVDRPRLKLLVIDPVNALFDYRFHKVRVLETNQVESYFHSNSADYMRKLGKDNSAHIKKASELWPGNPQLVWEMLKGKMDPDYVLDILNGMDSSFLTAEIHQLKATAEYALGNIDAAIAEVDRALRLDQANGMAWLLKAELHALGKSKETHIAMAAVTNAIRSFSSKQVSGGEFCRYAAYLGKRTDFKVSAEATDLTRMLLMQAYGFAYCLCLSEGDISQAFSLSLRGLAIEARNPRFRLMKGIALAVMADYCKNNGDSAGAGTRIAQAKEVCRQLGGDGGVPKAMLEAYLNKLESGEAQPLEIIVRTNDKTQKKKVGLEEFVRLQIVALDGRIEMKTGLASRLRMDTRGIPPIGALGKLGGGACLGSRIRSTVEKAGPRIKRESARIATIRESELGQEEKDYLVEFIRRSTKAEIEAFVAVNHVQLMRELGKKADFEYLAIANTIGELVEIKVLVGLAKLGLGDAFGETCGTIAKKLEEHPLDIDRRMIQNAITVARILVPIDDEKLRVAAIRHIEHRGETPTEDEINRLLPVIKREMIRRITLTMHVEFFD